MNEEEMRKREIKNLEGTLKTLRQLERIELLAERLIFPGIDELETEEYEGLLVQL